MNTARAATLRRVINYRMTEKPIHCQHKCPCKIIKQEQTCCKRAVNPDAYSGTVNERGPAQRTGSARSAGDEMRISRLEGAEGCRDGNRKRQRDGGDSEVTGERRQTRTRLLVCSATPSELHVHALVPHGKCGF